jgi:hypothetical protein
LVGHLHGDLRPQPVPGGGTRFVLTLPGDEPTWDLVCALDGALAELDSWFTAGGGTLAVLRRDEGLDPQAVAGAAAALRAALGDPRALCLQLGTTTWVVATGAAVRALLAALPGSLGTAADPSVRVHLQRVRRGRAADRVLLQSLVRCRHPLVARHAKRKEVTDASGPARG